MYPPWLAVAGIEPLQGEGLELRMLVKLRVQNPNDSPLDYDGVYVKLDVLGKTFASGAAMTPAACPVSGKRSLRCR